ncbi:MAG: FHA domain-containing protein [Pirellulales bacterium]|nr:FHA domain-containing protein [Pirellulales bacterium]
MAEVTLRVLDGADRGRVFDRLSTPVTIGREEGNSVQLNDERISRFHIKIQEDEGRLVLTDLESTNGTRVNGEDVQLRILRFGDVIALGRSVLLFGTKDQIVSRLDQLRESGLGLTGDLDPSNMSQHVGADPMDFELKWGASESLHSSLHIPTAPELPSGLSPGQAAQISEIFEFLHLQSRTLVQSVSLPEDETHFKIDLVQWQQLLELQSHLAEYLRKIGGSETP